MRAASKRIHLANWIIEAILCAGLLWCTLWSVRTALYEQSIRDIQQVDPLSSEAMVLIRRAISLRPDKAEGHRLLAQAESFDNPTAAQEQILKAITLDPVDGENWQIRALLDLQDNHSGQANADLLKAASLDRGFQSHYELANLALLQGKSELAREATIQAFRQVPLDHLPELLRTAEQAGLADSLDHILPSNKPTLYLGAISYYITTHRPSQAQRLWNRLHCPDQLRQTCGTTGNALAQEWANQAFQSANAISQKTGIQNALDDWNQMVQMRYIDQPKAAWGHSTDPNFKFSWQGPAFSWRDFGFVPSEIIAGIGPGGVNAVQFDLDGMQPDTVMLIEQMVAVHPGHSYSVHLTARRAVPGKEDGVRLEVATASRVLYALQSKLGMDWQTTAGTFTTDSDTSIVQIRLVYGRPQGQERLHDPMQFTGASIVDVGPTSAPYGKDSRGD